MAPKKKPGKKPVGDNVSATKKPASKKTIKAEKRSGGVAKKLAPKKPMGKTPASIKEETNKRSTKATGNADTMIKNEDISDKPAGHTRAATKKASREEPTKPTGKTVTVTGPNKKPKGKPAKSAGKTSAATKEPTAEPVDIPSEEDTPAVIPKRKRKTEDKCTETTDLPIPKSPKLDEGSSPSPFRISREIKTLEEFALEGWDTGDFNDEICCIDTVEPCRIPSPFANLGDRAERLRHIIENHAHDRVKGLFDNLNCRNPARLLSWLDESPPGAFVAVQSNTTGPELFKVRSNRPVFSLELKKEDKKPTGIFLDFHIRKNADTDEIGYFAVNKKWQLFIINEKHIGRKCAAGPLPDFAVIQIASWTIFWWRTRADLNYIPEALPQGAEKPENMSVTKNSPPPPPNGREEEDTTKKPSLPPLSAQKGGDTAKKPSPPPKSAIEGGDTVGEPITSPTGIRQDEDDTTEPSEPPLTWEQILDDNLAAHCRAKQESLVHSSAFHKITNYNGMEVENVLVAVATIWEALRNEGMTYAFAGTEVLDPAFDGVVERGEFQSLGVVGAKENKFIMPLYFPPEEKKSHKFFKKNLEKQKKQKQAKTEGEKETADDIRVQEPLGHILLAVAEKGFPNAERVRIEIRDSLKEYENAEAIHKRAQKLAEIWLGMDLDPTFIDVNVVQQPKTIHTCGLFTILNAWAVMLDVPLLKDKKRGNEREDKEFLKAALKIVNLALAGFMNSRTIQAFLNVYGYSEPQDVNSKTRHNVDAVRMDPERLKRYLQQQKSKDGGESLPSKSSSIDSAHSTGSIDLQKALFESKVQQFIELVPGATRDQAINFLNITEGDVDKALMEFKRHETSPADGPAGAEAS